MHHDRARRPELPALTSLRFFAAASIVALHLQGRFGLPKDFAGDIALENGVSFFFVLSGFILTYAHRDLAGREERLRFYVSRFARIWPLHVACIVIVYLFLGSPRAVGTADNLPIGLLNLALLQSWVPRIDIALSYNAVSWSLSVEAFFYALFPFIILHFRSRWLVWVASSIGLIVALVGLAHLADVGPGQQPVYGMDLAGFLYLNPAARLLEFVTGILTAFIWFATREWLDANDRRATMMQVGAVILVLVAYVAAAPMSRIAFSLDWAFHQWVRTSGVTFLPSALLIYACAAEAGTVRRFLGMRFLVYLGRVSFALYLFHITPVNYVALHSWFMGGYPEPLQLVTMLAFILLVSMALHHVIEEPMRRRIVATYDRWVVRQAVLKAHSSFVPMQALNARSD